MDPENESQSAPQVANDPAGEVDAPDAGASLANAAPTAEDESAQRNRFSIMKAHLAKQPKVRVRVREETTVQLNGYTFVIAPNVSVMVPEQVEEILIESGRI